MLYIYPSNRLEDLAVLAAQVIKHRPCNIFDATTILVPNPGMQHWLSLQLAENLDIAMNIECPLPTRFIWDICRKILGKEKIPQKSPYKREIMTWRIHDIIESEVFHNSSIYSSVSAYWAQTTTDEERQYRQFSFAQQLADVFEQYMVFRPTWLSDWEREVSHTFPKHHQQDAQTWQMWFWQALVDKQPVHPIRLQHDALKQMKNRKTVLPKDIYLFAINSISPLYLSFFDALAQHTNVHFFQLNPCVNYWGDAHSDLVVAKMQRKAAYDASLNEERLHPILRNLGQQGRDLVNLVNELQHQEIAAFSDETPTSSESSHLLHCIQNDILHARVQTDDRCDNGPASIAVHACHSVVRELQVLKDCMLAKFEENPYLQPKDILVMCPSIEDYSPYIASIFTQSTFPQNNIPVSISDRKPIESAPLIVGFLHLLSLHNSRFDATGVINFISIEAVSTRFKLSSDDIALCAYWIKHAHIDWAIDHNHQSELLSQTVATGVHTWRWGIQRILSGLCNSVNDFVVDGTATVSNLEGSNAEVFGRFLYCLEELERCMHRLFDNKTLVQWTTSLTELLRTFFVPNDNDKLAVSLLHNAISGLTQQQHLGDFNRPVNIKLVAVSLESALNIPETRSQFHSGNVTFCSMLPMRSIPFKMIAILGLNSSDFPRQDVPFEINLIHALGAQPGDRSRRGDDRYLFLESLISAREYLHLSYQYRKVSDNAVRQPSLVLQMLIDYCGEHYKNMPLPLIEHPLHPFSEHAFVHRHGYKGSFDKAWWQKQQALLNASAEATPVLFSQDNPSSDHSFTVQDTAAFLKDSLAYYGKRVLSLYLQPPESRDFKTPYVVNKLTEYQIRQSLLLIFEQSRHSNEAASQQASVLIQHWRLSGELPFLIGLDNTLAQYLHETQQLADIASSLSGRCRVKGQFAITNASLSYDFDYIPEHGVRRIKVNPNKPSLQHILGPWIEYLLLLHHLKLTPASPEYNELSAGMFYIDAASKRDQDAFNSKHIENTKKTIRPYNIMLYRVVLSPEFTPQEALENLLKCLVNGTQAALLLDLNLATDILKYDDVQDALGSTALRAKWQEAAQVKSGKAAIGSSLPNPYFDFLLQDMPAMTEHALSPFFECFSTIVEMDSTEIMVFSGAGETL